MKKIAMLCCEKANDHCSGAACFTAYNNRTGGFEIYKDVETQLTAYTRCSNCSRSLNEDEGMKMKLDRLIKEGTETVHIGVCAHPKDVKCETMSEYAKYLEDNGIEIVWRTH